MTRQLPMCTPSSCPGSGDLSRELSIECQPLGVFDDLGRLDSIEAGLRPPMRINSPCV